MLLETNDPALATIGALALGFTVGSELDFTRLYDLTLFLVTAFHSTIYAVSLSVFYVGAVLAPVLVGQLYAYAGDYSLVTLATITFLRDSQSIDTCSRALSEVKHNGAH